MNANQHTRILHAAGFAGAWFVGAVLLAGAASADVAGSQDHELIPRYEGSDIIYYKQTEFDEFELPMGKAVNRKITESLSLEGEKTKIRYRVPKGPSSLQVFRNYELALAEAGFEVLYACKKVECGGGNDFFNAVYDLWTTPLAGNSETQRYLSAVLEHPGGKLYARLYVVRNYSTGGPNRHEIITELDLLEVKTMEEKMVFIEASEMEQAIEDRGGVSIYGIYFEHNEATLKPESKPTLDEMAGLLKNSPGLKLYVVGHTDATGTYDYNVDLSQRRAKAVVNALVSDYGIASDRLVPVGVGLVAPVASNRTDEGRAKNRRVELVER